MRKHFPQHFGRYVLTRLLGEGGMAEVYEANVRVAEGLTKWIVIKKIRQEFADQPEFMRMFVDEAKIALSLNHANLVQVFDFGQVRGRFYLAMELIDGIDMMALFHAVESKGKTLPEGIIAYIAQQAATGLAYAHDKSDDYGQPLGIVHRDVSPHNIMVDVAGNVKILDFGIARTKPSTAVHQPDAQGDKEQTLKGKVAYMSPEQVHGRTVDRRADIYSLGVVMYECLLGKLIFRHPDHIQALERVRSEPLGAVRHAAPQVSTQLAAIVDRALARDVHARYPSARHLAGDLAKYLHSVEQIIDAPTLAEYVADFRERSADPIRSGAKAEEAMTREMADSQVSGFPVTTPRHRDQRVVLVQAVFRAPHEWTGDRNTDVAPFLEVVRSIAFKRDAHVHRVDAQAALLAFGTVINTGDDADRALRVARALREAIGDSAPGTGLGLALVETKVRITRSQDGKHKLTLPEKMGEQLQRLAARSVDDHIMVAAGLLERLGQAWHFGATRVLDSVSDHDEDAQTRADDLQQAAPFFGPLSEMERHVAHPPGRRVLLYGRDLELKILRDAFSETIRHQQSRTMIVVAAPGLGRHAIIERFTASLPRGACAVLRGVGQWSHRNTPFRMFLQLIQQFLGLNSDSDKIEISDKLQDYGVRQPDQLAEALASSLSLSGTSESALDPNERRDRLSRLIRRLVSLISQRSPLLIVAENLQFIDQQSLDILHEAAQTVHHQPIFTIVTSRPGPRAEALAARSNASVVQLQELDQRARRELIVRRFKRRDEADRLADAVLARTGGNPLFIEEVLASLLQRNVIGWDPQGRFLKVRDPRALIELPPSIGAVLEGRLDDLEPERRAVLQTAAILGRSFRADELLTLAADGADAHLDEMIDDGLLERDTVPSPSGAPRIRFATVSMHEVCKLSTPVATSKRVHMRAAEIKRARADYSPGRDDGPIAEHLIQAGKPSLAVAPAVAAARDARDVAGNVEAYYYYSQALGAMGPQHARRFEVLLEREPILRAWGRRRAQGADIRELITLAESHGPPQREAQAATLLLRFYVECGRANRAEKLAPRLEQLIRSLADPTPFLAPLCELKSEVEFARGRFPEAERLAREGLRCHGGDKPTTRSEIRLTIAVGRVALATHRYEAAHECFVEAAALGHDAGHRRLEAEALNLQGEAAREATRYQEAVDCFRKALSIDRDLGDRVSTGVKLANLGITYTNIGLFSRAERYLRKALELHEALGNPRLLNDVMIHLGVVAMELDDLESAQGLLMEAARIAKQRGDTPLQLRARAHFAAVLLRQDAPDNAERARGLAKEVLRAAREADDEAEICRALHVLAQVEQRRQQLEAAIGHERDAVALVRRGAAPVDGVLYIHTLGLLLIEGGRDEEASTWLREAATLLTARRDDLRDPELRRIYAEQPLVRRILEDGRPAGYADRGPCT
ncbi:MAG: protein kinase [Nannocystaceae bacterium]